MRWPAARDWGQTQDKHLRGQHWGCGWYQTMWWWINMSDEWDTTYIVQLHDIISCHKLFFDAPSRSSIVWRAGVVQECKHKYSLIISSGTGIENTNKDAVNPEAACNNIIIFHCSLFTVIFIVFVSLQFVQLLLASSQCFAMMLNTSNSVLQ